MTVATDVPTMQVQAARTDEQLEARTVFRLATTAKHERGRRFAHRLTDPTSAASSSSRAPGVIVGRRPEARFPTDEGTEWLDGDGRAVALEPVTPSRPSPNHQRDLRGRSIGRARIATRFTGGAQ